MVLNIFHTTPDGIHCTFPGVSCGAVANRFTFGSVFLISEEEIDEGDHSAFLWGCGGVWG